MEDRSLDDFIDDADRAESDVVDEPDEAAGDDEGDTEVAGDTEAAGDTEVAGDSEAVEPARTTYAEDPAGAACAACGASVRRRWQSEVGLVCADCKEW